MKSILQSKQWANFKRSQGFEFFELDEIFVHEKSLPLGQNFLYVPEISAQEVTPQKIEELIKLATEQKSIFLRIEFVDHFDHNADKVIQSFGFKKAFEEVQPKWRQIVDISIGEDAILAQMKQKGRYNLHLSERKGVKIKVESSQQAIREFYDLYQETTKREGIAGRSLKYFENMLDSFKDTDYLEVFLANYHGKPVAGALIGFYDGQASYLYGGSSRGSKEVMAPYLMHWYVIQEAKKRGCTDYDLIGRTPPEKEGILQLKTHEGHKWSGVTKFKEQFGGRPVEILGSYDYVARPFAYNIFKMIEKIRRKNA